MSGGSPEAQALAVTEALAYAGVVVIGGLLTVLLVELRSWSWVEGGPGDPFVLAIVALQFAPVAALARFAVRLSAFRARPTPDRLLRAVRANSSLWFVAALSLAAALVLAWTDLGIVLIAGIRF